MNKNKDRNKNANKTKENRAQHGTCNEALVQKFDFHVRGKSLLRSGKP